MRQQQTAKNKSVSGDCCGSVNSTLLSGSAEASSIAAAPYRFKTLRRVAFFTGLLLVGIGAFLFILFISAPSNFWDIGWLSQLSLKACARVAVAGCVLAAIGSWDTAISPVTSSEHQSRLQQ